MQVESGLTIKYSGRVPPLDLSNVGVCHHQTTETDLRWQKIHLPKKSHHLNQHLHHHLQHHNHHHHHHHNQLHTITSKNDLQQTIGGSDGLPIDPRDWTRADVWKWLINMAASERLDANLDLAQKFPMNGKALCLMSLDMYLSRVPIGGKMLYRDFRVRLARAMSL